MPTLLMDNHDVAHLKSKSRTASYDEKTVGLVLRVGARARTWSLISRNGGDPEWLKLGAYPAVGLAEARTLVPDPSARHRHREDRSGHRTRGAGA